MANPEHLEIFKRGAAEWNQWRKEHPDITPNLTKADLQGAALWSVNFRGANLQEANLRRALGLESIAFPMIISKKSTSEKAGPETRLKSYLLGKTVESYLADHDIFKDVFNSPFVFEKLFSAPDLREANLLRADLREADLSGADLCGAHLSETDLAEVNLSKAMLNDAIIIGAKLNRASLIEADLQGANLKSAVLVEADLSAALLIEANLQGADLRRANLQGANLRGADLRGADLRGTDLHGAALLDTNFSDVDLSETKGLGTVKHFRPSTISISTIYKSGGAIPEIFLRGCGVPENFITFHKSLVKSPIEFYSCFISYSTKNQEFAERLYADLQSNGVRCWYAPEDLKIGDRFRVSIDESIRLHDKLLLILSKDSVESQWVEKEVETAMEKERERKETVLFPIRLDNAILDEQSGWAADIRRTRHIGDFRGWKDHDEYRKAFDRLLRDLRAECNSQ